jgi:hypothetical protein
MVLESLFFFFLGASARREMVRRERPSFRVNINVPPGAGLNAWPDAGKPVAKD